MSRIITNNLKAISGVMVFGTDAAGKQTILVEGDARLLTDLFFEDKNPTPPQIAQPVKAVAAPATPAKKVEVENHPEGNERERLMAEIKSYGVKGQGLGNCKIETLRSKLAALKNSGATPAPVAPATPAPTESQPQVAKRGRGRPPMKAEVIDISKCQIAEYTAKSGKIMSVYTLNTNGEKTLVFSPAKKQPEGLQPGFMSGCKWWAHNSTVKHMQAV